MTKEIIGLVMTEEKREAAFPFDAHWQTACLPVSNQPNILRTVQQMKQAGLTEIYVVERYRNNQIHNSLKDHGDIHYLSSFEDFLSIPSKDTFILYVKGHHYIPENLFSSLIEELDSEVDGVLSVSEPTAYKNATNQFGIQTKEEYIEALFGFTRKHYINYYTNGIYLLHEKILEHHAMTEIGFQNVPAGGMPSQTFHIESLIQATIEQDFSYRYVVSEETVYDVTFPWELLEANIEATKKWTSTLKEKNDLSNENIHLTAVIEGNIQLGENIKIGPHVLIKGNAIIGDNTVITNGAILEENVIIGSDCFITDYAKITSGTTIGNYSKVGYTAEVSGVFFEGVSAVHNSEFFGIAGKSVDIAAGCHVGSLRFDDQETIQNVKGKRYTGKYSNGAFIGDYTRLGIGNLFFPGVRVGSNSAIGPGAIIEKDSPKNTLVQVHQEKTQSKWGPERYGWS